MNKFAIAIIAIMLAILGVVLTRVMSLESEVSSLRDQVVLQTGAINKGLKNIVPLVLPKGIEDEIAKIEKQLKNKSEWPKTEKEIQQLNERLVAVVNKLPTWAQEEELPRIVPRRWEIEALWRLASNPSADAESLSTYVSSIEAHLANKPTDSSDELEKMLDQKMQQVKVEIPTAERSAAIKAAQLAIKNEKDCEGAVRQLVVYDGPEVKSLLNTLNDIILKKSFTQEIGLVEKDIEKFEKLSEPTLREYAIVRTNQAVMDMRLRVTSSGIKDELLDKKINNLDRKVAGYVNDASIARQHRDAEKLKKYQVWALGEIKQVRTLKTIEDIEDSKIPSKLERENPYSNARQRAKEQAWRVLIEELVLHMAPINQALLEPAVFQWFGKIYQKQFSDLDNEIGQLEIVTRFATATKKTLDSIP